MLQHLLRDVTGNVHDRLIARAALGKLSDEGAPVVMPLPISGCLERRAALLFALQLIMTFARTGASFLPPQQWIQTELSRQRGSSVVKSSCD
jgi:hypothetical protein